MSTHSRNGQMLGMGLLGAAALGAVIGMLLAPKAGRETRGLLGEKVKKSLDKLGTAPEKMVDELNSYIDGFGHDVPEDMIERLKPYYNRMVNLRDRLVMAINKHEADEIMAAKDEAKQLIAEVNAESKAKTRK